MEWVQSTLSGENGQAIQLVTIFLLLVVGLILIFWIFRRIVGTPARRASRNRVPRLSITDVTAVDDKRFLVLARRDNVEHLLLIGGSSDLVVETGIIRTKAAAQSATNEAANTAPPAAVAKPEKEEPEPVENETVVSTPIAAVASTGAAGLAAAGSVASNVKETTVDAASSVADVAVDAKDAIVDTVEDVVAATTDQSEAVVEAVEETVEATTDVVADAGGDLEAKISEQLDDALVLDDIVLDEPEATETADASASGSAEDEMQKLLDELANETKEPAQ